MIWLVVLLLLALIGAPLFVIIAGSALIGFANADYDLQLVPIEIYRLADMPVLVAIPLFTFAGYLLGESQAPRRLVRLSRAWLGWLPGGLPIVALVTCALFTAFTGASGVTIVALGALLVPALAQGGYPERFNLGLVTSSGSLGLLFAPSLPLILYGVIAQQLAVGETIQISELFIAGILPGALMIVVLGIWSMRQGLKLDDDARQAFDWNEGVASLKDAALELPLPFVVLGGIYQGFLVISEAAVITAAYVFTISVLVRREIAWSKLAEIVRESMMLVGAILIILGVSLASTNYVIDAEVPTRLFEFVGQHIDSKFTFIAVLIVFLLALGMLLDIFSALVIVVPIILPIAVGYGIHPIHLGILFLAAMQLGYFTPPVGMNLFIASFRFDKPIMTLYRATIPFFLLLLACVLLIGFYSPLSLLFVD